MVLRSGLSLLLLIGLSLAAPPASPSFRPTAKQVEDQEAQHIIYNQQQHATGHNVRVNLNKILIAILPLDEAISSLGSSYEDIDFGDLTMEDLKPPPPPTPTPTETEEGAEEAEIAAVVAAVQKNPPPPTGTVTGTISTLPALGLPPVPASALAPAPASGMRIEEVKVRRNPVKQCSSADQAAGKCRVRRVVRPDSAIARLLIPFLQQFNKKD